LRLFPPPPKNVLRRKWREHTGYPTRDDFFLSNSASQYYLPFSPNRFYIEREKAVAYPERQL
jgi:hypothetical protein